MRRSTQFTHRGLKILIFQGWRPRRYAKILVERASSFDLEEVVEQSLHTTHSFAGWGASSQALGEAERWIDTNWHWIEALMGRYQKEEQR